MYRPITELTEYRKRHEPPLSIDALARQLDVSKATVSRWEAGKRRPDRRYVSKLAELTGVPALELMGIDA